MSQSIVICVIFGSFLSCRGFIWTDCGQRIFWGRVLAEQGDRMENIINLCMDSYSMEKQCGRLYHRFADGPVRFSSLLEALDQMNDLYDRTGLPQAATKIRSFLVNRKKPEQVGGRERDMADWTYSMGKEVKVMASLDHVMGHKGVGATFIIRVQYRQHTSWQGEVTWVDGQKKEYFRSALELVKLMDSILSEEKKEDGE